MRAALVLGPACKGSCCEEGLRVDERVGVETADTVILGALFSRSAWTFRLYRLSAVNWPRRSARQRLTMIASPPYFRSKWRCVPVIRQVRMNRSTC